MSDVEDYLTDGRLTTAGWQAALSDGRLLGQACGDCGHVTGAPKAACARCGSRALETTELPEEGTVYSVTRVEVAPEGFDAPYHVGIVSVGGGRVMARLADDAAIGETVTFRGAASTPEGPSPRFG